MRLLRMTQASMFNGMIKRTMARFASKAVMLGLLTISPLVLADPAATISEVKPIMMGFGKNLKAELKQAMMSGGPIQGIAICNTQASEIAKQASQTGWAVARTSLKWRNDKNEPDQWEKEQLIEFNRKLKAGESPNKLWSVYEDEKEVRVMKAIMTEGVCLACHGESLMPAVSKKLNELYPNDHATGFIAGDIRGAFSLKKLKI